MVSPSRFNLLTNFFLLFSFSHYFADYHILWNEERWVPCCWCQYSAEEQEYHNWYQSGHEFQCKIVSQSSSCFTVNRILYLWLYRLVAAIGHLANFMLLLIQHVIKSVYLHDVEDWDRKGAHAWSIVCLLLLYVFSNFLCCVTIVKVSSIRF